jgi:AGZA family xanthine/uracil permease-like MFS transporter
MSDHPTPPSKSASSSLGPAPWFVRGDVDGFFGLFVDNLLQLMLVYALGQACGFDTRFVSEVIMPGAAVSILLGNLYYAWQARRLMKRENRSDVTALPYGINTPSLFVFLFGIMAPVYIQETNQGTSHEAARDLAWQAGLFAAFLSGLIEALGAFAGPWLRKHTPRAALLSALAGIAITFISMSFIFQMFASPLIALVPLVVILIAYAGRLRFPLGLPGGLISILAGVILAWVLFGLESAGLSMPFETWSPPMLAQAGQGDGGAGPPALLGWFPPLLRMDFAMLGSIELWQYFGLILPMGLFNVIGSLQNLESAEAAGDRYPTVSSMLVNGVGTIVGACLGSPFPTTIYIGHPAWKAMGARAGYSVLDGLVIAPLCCVGGVALILQVVPLEAALPIILWIGIIITAQAFQATPHRHALAVAIGLIPAIAAWALQVVIPAATGPGNFEQTIDRMNQSGFYIHGLIALERGYLISCMLFSSLMVFVIDRKLRTAAAISFLAAGLSAVGLIHAYEVTPQGAGSAYVSVSGSFPFIHFVAVDFALAYLLGGLVLLGMAWNGARSKDEAEPTQPPSEDPRQIEANPADSTPPA